MSSRSPNANTLIEALGARASGPAVSVGWWSHSPLQLIVGQRVLADGLMHESGSTWATDAEPVLPWEVIASDSNTDKKQRSVVMVAGDGSVILCHFSRNQVRCEVHARTPARAHELLGEVRRQLPEASDALGDRVAVTFWSWHGMPGTGKTWALRALCREWSSWASAHYITDPENLLGVSVSYMLKVILGENEDDEEETDEVSGPGVRDWRLLIMEDTGELLTKDAKHEVGQGLSRLLNVCDGLKYPLQRPER